MRIPRWGSLCAFSLVSVVVGLVVFSLREPRYAGKPLHYWLEEINRAGNHEAAKIPIEAIRAMGPRLLPHLLRYLEGRESLVRAKLREFLQKQNLIRSSPRNPLDLHSASVFALTELGERAAPILHQIRFGEDHAGKMVGETVLQYLGPIASNTLVRACQSTNENVRIKAAFLLVKATAEGVDRGSSSWGRGRVQPNSRLGTADLMALGRNLKHPNGSVRLASAESLSWLFAWLYRDPSTIDRRELPLPELREALHDQDANLRNAAAEALKIIGRN